MARDIELRRKDMISNPTPRVPICLVLDCSPSMSGDTELGSIIQQNNPRPIDELNVGIKTLFQSLKEDDVAKYSAEICIVVFSGIAKKLLDFDSIEEVDPPIVELDTEYGGTSIGKAVELALNLLNERKEEYREAGVDYFQPWLVLMTDGHPTDYSHVEIAQKVSDLVMNKRLVVFPIGIGDGTDMNVLSQFSPKRSPLKLKGLCFKEFFEWLSRSLSITSKSMPGESVKLEIDRIKDWSEL